MKPEKWENLIGDIKDKFEVEEHDKKHLDEQGGTDIESIIFKGPLGRMKLEFITKPVVLDKKTSYSQRIGSQVDIEYIYSEDEKTNRLMAYKWNEAQNEWIEIDADSFS
ncbi:hypothetical protein KKE74_00485 [Patescibacteria group bacterium]|nr:hypothetical protein [Patescibacteria group bacterium]MBU2472492.1 hypothetical protein [Patescibacteria group bacterium]